jgi:hypothetical protein
MRKWILIDLFASSTYLHPLLETDEVSGENVVTTICNEGDGVILCKWDSHGKVVTTRSCVFFGLSGTNTMVMFQVFLCAIEWIFFQ